MQAVSKRQAARRVSDLSLIYTLVYSLRAFFKIFLFLRHIGEVSIAAVARTFNRALIEHYWRYLNKGGM